MAEAQCLRDDPHPAHSWDSTRRGWECPGRAIPRAARLAGYRDPQIDDPTPPSIDARHLYRQRDWSRRTFGPGLRVGGIVEHIRKELQEIEANPGDVEEWADVVILALDGAWRAGWEPQQIIDAVRAKQAKNEARTWPDWREFGQDEAIEHIEALR